MPNGTRKELVQKLSGTKRGLTLATPFHQFLNGVTRILPVMKNCMHLLGDRHFNAPGFRQTDRRCSRKNSFGDHAMHASNDFR